MSATESSESSTPALGCRENFWGEEEIDDQVATLPTDRDWAVAQPTGDYHKRRLESVVYKVLKHLGARVLCPECLYERQRAEPLSEPLHYVDPCEVELPNGETRLMYADHRQHRHCPACTLVTWGGPLSQLETEALVAAADTLLRAADLPERRHDELLSDAKAWKIGTDLNDDTILKRITRQAVE